MISRLSGDTLLSDLVLSAIGAVALVAFLPFVFANLDPSRSTAEIGDTIGSITASSGELRRRGDETLVWRDVRTKALLFSNDALYTAENSSATVLLKDGTVLSMGEKSLVVVRLNETADEKRSSVVVLDLVRGSASGEIGSEEVSIRVGDTEVSPDKGATLRLSRDGDAADVAVSHGRAVIGGDQISGGQRQRFNEAGAIGQPSRIAVSLSQPANNAQIYFDPSDNESTVALSWKRVSGLGPHIVDLAHDADFERSIAQIEVDGTELARRFAPGIYYWRVSRRTDQGATVSERRKFVVVADTPPTILQPLHDEELFRPNQETLSVAWAPVADVDMYAVELAAGTRFHKAIAHRETSRTFFDYEDTLPEGQYCYRVRSISEGRGESPWSPPTCFVLLLKERLPAPALYQPTVEIVPNKVPQ